MTEAKALRAVLEIVKDAWFNARSDVDIALVAKSKHLHIASAARVDAYRQCAEWLEAKIKEVEGD